MTNRLLATLAEADVTGRIAENIDSSRELIELYRQSAAENNSLDGPFSFASPRSRYAYFNGRLDSPHAELFDDSWGEVVILSGLPGTGKDTFARKYLSDRPIVSLDTIREELKIPPDANQDAVAAAARERAKELLRAKQPFVWNATNVTEFIRAPIVRLCVDYGAAVRMVFLEASWEETLRRNKNRSKAVPESVLDRLLTKLEPPTVREAHQAEWHV